MDHILIDADVILDFFFDREPFAAYATQIFILCENQRIKGYTTPVIISNVYYLLNKIAKHDVIIDKLKSLLSIIDIAQIDKNIIIEALNSKFKDFEDALQYFSATESECEIIITRNGKDFKQSLIPVMTAEEFLNSVSEK